jgi:hypothetical protein
MWSVSTDIRKVLNIQTHENPFQWDTRWCMCTTRRRSYAHLWTGVNAHETFNVYGSVHRKYIPIYIQQDATLHSLFISGNCSTCFGWYLHPSSGAHTTVFTASGICQTVTATCRYSGRSINGVRNTRSCRYICLRSWWWVVVPPETCRAVFR